MAICVEFNDLGRLVNHIFFSMGPLLYQFSAKNKENLLSKSLNFLQDGPLNSVLFSCAAVSNPSLRVKVCEYDGKILNYKRHIFTCTKYY